MSNKQTTTLKGATARSPLFLAVLAAFLCFGPSAPEACAGQPAAAPAAPAKAGANPDNDPDDQAPSAATKAPAAKAAFQARPWLRRPGTTTMTLSWISSTPDECTLTYGTGTAADTRLTVADPQVIEFAPQPPPAAPATPPTPANPALAPAAQPAAKDAPAATPSTPATPEVPLEKHYLFTAKLDGLKPGTEYRYEVTCMDSKAPGTFRTAPATPEPFTFVVTSDVHYRDSVSSGFAAQKPSLIINCGDLVDHEHYREYIQFFSESVTSAAGRWPLFAARGNHDGSAKWLAKFFSGPEDRHYYSFDYGDAHFVCLDTLLGRSDKSGKYQAMLEWCEADLAASKARWKIVFYHFPSYDVGKHLSAWGRKDFLPVFRKHGVDMVLCGHDHSYQRFKPMFTKGANEAHPITHIVAAAGGSANLYRMEQEPCLAFTEVSIHSFLAVSISADKLTGRCIATDGREVDSFTIKKNPDGSLDPAWLAAAVPEESFGVLRDSVRACFKDLGLPEDPRGGKPMTIKFSLGAADRPIRFELRAEKRSQGDYEVTPVSGDVPAGGSKEIEFTAKLRKPEAYAELKDVPWLRLECLLDSNGEKASIIRYLVYRPPAPPAPPAPPGKAK